MSTETRGKPFVAYISQQAWRNGVKISVQMYKHLNGIYDSPVVVTPLLPDDPRIGETWEWMGQRVTIMGAPFLSSNGQEPTHIQTSEGVISTSRLRRPPVMKTFHASVRHYAGPDNEFKSIWIDIRAESKEAAMAQIEYALKEVK